MSRKKGQAMRSDPPSLFEIDDSSRPLADRLRPTSLADVVGRREVGPTRAGLAHVCCIIDACSRMIAGSRAAPTMRTETVLDAIEMAR